MRRRLLVLVPSAALAICLYAVQLPLFAEAPGPAHDVLPRIDIDGTTTYQPQGRLLFTTVNVGRLNLYELIAAWLDPDHRVVSETALIPPGFTDAEYERVGLSQMDSSKIAAVVASLDRLGEYPEEHGPGVLVYATQPGTPAHGRLFAGDVITDVDGEAIDGQEDLRAVIARAGPGATLRLRVEPVEGGGRSETVPVRTAREPETGRAIIGIAAVANFPFDVSIQSGQIGGPSAGLMWAVGVTELLTPGDLGEGRSIAGTGGIGLDGRVFRIGGVGLKVLTAERAGADAFLLPRGNLAEARKLAGDIELIPVGTLDEAVAYLEG